MRAAMRHAQLTSYVFVLEKLLKHTNAVKMYKNALPAQCSVSPADLSCSRRVTRRRSDGCICPLTDDGIQRRPVYTVQYTCRGRLHVRLSDHSPRRRRIDRVIEYRVE